MAAELRAVEVSGTLDASGRLTLDEPLVSVAPGRVRLIVLALPAANGSGARTAATDLDERDEGDERKWLAAAAANPAFAFLRDPAEDIYTSEDGLPFRDEG